MFRVLKSMTMLALVLALAGCDPRADLEDAPADLGPFKLGHNIVVARNPTIGPLSRTATEAEWKAVFEAAVEERFGRYQGDRLYHLGISVDGYALAVGGVPVVASPKSALIFTVTLWDDALGRKLNEEAMQLTVLEQITGETLVGSGLTQTKKQQMENLSASAAKAIQNWMLKHPEWFTPPFN